MDTCAGDNRRFSNTFVTRLMTICRFSLPATPSFACGSRSPARGWRLAGVSLLALALAACAQQEVATPAGADDTADSAALGPVLVNEEIGRASCRERV